MKKRNIFWGLAFVVFAIGLILNAFNVFPVQTSWVRLIITTFLIILSIDSLIHLSYVGIFMPLTFALIYNQDILGLSGQGWTLFIAGVLLSIGLSILFRKRSKKVYYTSEWEYDDNLKDDNIIDIEVTEDAGDKRYHKKSYTGQAMQHDSDGVYVKVEAAMSDATRYVNAENIKRVDVESSLGQLRVYFEQSTFVEDAVINVDNSLGKVILYLPKGYAYINNVSAIMGTTTGNVEGREASNKRVYITGDVALGTLTIIYI